MNLTREKNVFNIKSPGEILRTPVFLVKDRNGHYVNSWKIRDLRCTNPIKMGITLICAMFGIDLVNMDFSDPPGPDGALYNIAYIFSV